MLRNVLAVVAGFLVGGIINGVLISVGPAIVPPPEGADLTTVEGLQAAMPLLRPQHFLMPFLAHAIGTFAGALVACTVAATYKHKLAMAVGILFLCGGIVAAFMIPAPGWFIALDLLLAYLPMAWLATRLVPSRPRPLR